MGRREGEPSPRRQLGGRLHFRLAVNSWQKLCVLLLVAFLAKGLINHRCMCLSRIIRVPCSLSSSYLTVNTFIKEALTLLPAAPASPLLTAFPSDQRGSQSPSEAVSGSWVSLTSVAVISSNSGEDRLPSSDYQTTTCLVLVWGCMNTVT